MQLINLVFGMLLATALFTGAATILLDVATVYPSVGANTTYIASLNRSLGNLTIISTDMENAASAPSAPEAIFGLAFGFLGTAFQAVILLAATPAVMFDMAGLMIQSGGGLIPTWFMSSLIIALSFVFIVGILYYFTKVK